MRLSISVFSSILWYLVWISHPYPSFAKESPSARGLGDKLPLPGFIVSWLDDKMEFQAGDIAIIKIKPMDGSFNGSFNLEQYAIRFSLSVNGKQGNSSYVSGVIAYTEGDPSCWNMSFIPIRAGEFTAVVTEDYSGVTDSSLQLRVSPGHLYPSACLASWMNFVNEFVAGTKAYLLVLPKDAFGNNVSPGVDPPCKDYFMVSVYDKNGTVAVLLDVQYKGWNEFGYFGIEFIPTTAGSFLLHLAGDNQTLRGSPLPFLVKPGLMDINNSLGKWKYETSFFQIFSRLEMFIHHKDQFGNLVPDFYPLDARVVEMTTNLSIPVADLSFEVVAAGVQLLSFIVSEPGDFVLTIFDMKQNESITNMIYPYTVFIGYCNGSKSVVNGSGLVASVAGIMSYFKVYLGDMYQNPSPVDAQRLHVRIFCKNNSINLLPIIFPLRNYDENRSVTGKFYSVKGPSGTIPGVPASENGTSTRSPTAQASAFNVGYTPEKAGHYEICVFCGNIPLNGAHSYSMKVSPGLVNASLSGVLKFAPRVKRLAKNDVVVQLMDSFANPVPSYRTRLRFQMAYTNSSDFLTWAFVDNEDGSYVGWYIAKSLGAYNMCIALDDRDLSPCPFEVNVYEREYFPEARNDSISVWEGESIAFDVVSNDYVAGGQATILEWSTPLHGSLLNYGHLLRYSPYEGFFGDDSFSYIIIDKNKNVAIATAIISVLCRPPQFLSLPAQLCVTEDIISPKFGGFLGFEIGYSDIVENISVAARAHSGSVFLAPMPMQLLQPSRSKLSVSKGGRSGKDLIFSGDAESVNIALQFIQYLGNENFYGNDMISLYSINKNGMEDGHVPVFIEPTNDPPLILAPKFINLAMKKANDGVRIFEKQKDMFGFSVADTDFFSFPGNKSHFLVMFSVEVNDGVLSTSLPVHLLHTAELKIKDCNQWQPLQTYVTISNQFDLRGKGIRFRGTIGDCSYAMQQLMYEGTNDEAMLSIIVNDMGNYGCYPDCLEMMSLPLYTKATVNLIKRRPISSISALLLGSAIIAELVLMLLLGGILLFFICKCMNSLDIEGDDDGNIELQRVEDLDGQTMNAESTQNMANFRSRPPPFSFRSQHSSFRQRSRRIVEEPGNIELATSSRF